MKPMKQRGGKQVLALSGPFAIYGPAMTEIFANLGSMQFPTSGWGGDTEDEELPSSAPKPEGKAGAIAHFRFSGPVSKEDTCATYMTGGFSSMSAAKAVQDAANSGQFAGIAISWYTPGGQTAYMDEFARVLRETNSKVPIWSFCEDMTASAGYWAACQASQVWCSKNAIVGSIGTYMTVVDSSRAAEMDGYEVVVIKAGEHKADGTPGTPITEPMKARFQSTVDSLNETFISDISLGRGIDIEAAKKLNTGDVWVGEEAVKAGLCDKVGTIDEMLAAMASSLASSGTQNSSRPGMKPSSIGAKSEDETMDEKEKVGFLAKLASVLGLSSSIVAGAEAESSAQPAPEPAAPAVEKPVAPVAQAADPVSQLSDEDKAALEAGRAALKAQAEAAAKAEALAGQEGDEAEGDETPGADAPAEAKPEKLSAETVEAYTKAYNQVYGAGSLRVSAAANRLAGLSDEEVKVKTAKLEGSAKTMFGQGGTRSTSPTKSVGSEDQDGTKATRQALLASGIY